MQPANTLIEQVFRQESGKMTSVLCRLLGFNQLDLAQDLVQDTLLQAMNSWSYGRVPDNPQAWLYRVARNKAIDALRRNNLYESVKSEYSNQLASGYTSALSLQQLFESPEISDSQLRMIFACCHPEIPADAQVALVLKTLCGLSVTEIAHAFLTNTDTIAKRIYRAKEKIRSTNLVLELPVEAALKPRLDAVLKSLYLLFNEGYYSSQPNQLIRRELCTEAIRLCQLLTQYPLLCKPRCYALLALMNFQASRLNARVNDQGNIVLLREQNRAAWDQELIQQGFHWLEFAAEPFEQSTYHFEAGIAALHAAAPSFETTDWNGIYQLYDWLYQFSPNPVVAMNKAIASAYAIGRQHALQQMQRINGLEQHHLYHASLGELYWELGNREAARNCFSTALALTLSPAERELLARKRDRCN